MPDYSGRDILKWVLEDVYEFPISDILESVSFGGVQDGRSLLGQWLEVAARAL